MTYAYARVSAQDQNLTRQIEAFSKYGVERDYIFCDKKSGKNFERQRFTYYKIYRQTRQKLRPNHRGMEQNNEYYRRGYTRSRHATTRHKDKIGYLSR